MSPYSYDMNHALANERINRYHAEASSHRLARSAGPQGSGAFDRLAKKVGRGLDSIAESFKVDRRPQLPAI
jgi:hypothetical protein